MEKVVFDAGNTYPIRDQLKGVAVDPLNDKCNASKTKILCCRICGTIGLGGDYPFSTLAQSGYCDDCL